MKNFIAKKNIFLSQPLFNTIESLKNIAIVIYLVLGFTYLIAGGYTILENPYVCLPNHVSYNSNYFMYTAEVMIGVFHLFADLSATYFLLGISLVWSSLNYTKSQHMDFIFTIYFSLSGIIHWVESFDEDRDINNPLFSLIPLILIGVIIFLRKTKPQN